MRYASLPMYDWPEVRNETDAFWDVLRDELAAVGIDVPAALDREAGHETAWRSPGLILSQTCGWPLTHEFTDTLTVVGIPSYAAEGCGAGTYRSAIIAWDEADPLELAHGTIAFNARNSLSGYWALAASLASLGISADRIGGWIETGGHRESIRAVATGDAAMAAIDCVSWRLALDHEPVARQLKIVGWTEPMPALPFVTAIANASLAELLLAALEGAVRDSPLPFLRGVRAGSIADYAPVTALGERARAAGY